MTQNNIYLKDSYAFASTSIGLVSVIDTIQREVVLHENIFHPRGGGQPADSGYLNDNPVVDVFARDDDGKSTVVILVRDDNGLLAPGRCKIAATVNRADRLHVMALHSAGHLVNAAGRALGLTYRACNHRPGQASVEFSVHSEIDATVIASQIERTVQAAIQRDIDISILTDQAGWREVVIGDICRDPCGGTHVARTGALSEFAVRSIRNKNGVLRIGYTTAFREE